MIPAKFRSPRTYLIPNTTNWGDIFTPFLFKEGFGVDCVIQGGFDRDSDEFYAKGESLDQMDRLKAELFSCGSLLERIPPGFTGHVLGSGMGLSETRVDLSNIQSPLLLRGPLSAERCTANHSARFGDPGILASMFVTSTAKSYRYGVVPHYIDKGNGDLTSWVETNNALKIDIEAGIGSVIQGIASCEKVVSSCLHGLVIADSLGIPSKLIKLSDGLGEGFKFHDYYAAYGESVTPSLTFDDAFASCRARDVTAIRKDVLDAFTEYVETLKTYSKETGTDL